MPLLAGSDLELPRDPQQPLQAATKQYVDSTSLSLETVGILFDQFFDVVQPGYSVAMTPFYEWTETPVGVSWTGVNLRTTNFVEMPPNCFSGSGSVLAVNSGVMISRRGRQEGFFATSTIATSPLDSLNSFFSIPRVARLLTDGTLVILTHRCSNGYTLESVPLNVESPVKKSVSLTTSYWFTDIVQSKTDATRTVLVGCDSTGPAIFYSTNLAAPTKTTFSG